MKTTLINKSNFKKFAGYLLDSGTDKNSVLVGVTTDEGEVAGTASFTVYTGYAQLDSMHVQKRHRRKGAARSMMSTIRNFIDELGYRPISVDYPDSAEGVREFLDSEGFFSIPGEDYYEFAMRNAAPLFEKVKPVSAKGVKSLKSMSRAEQNGLIRFLAGMKMKPDFLDDKNLRRDLTFVMVKDSQICGFLAVTQDDINVLRIDQVVSVGNNMVFAAMVKTFMKTVIMGDDVDTLIRFYGTNEKLVSVLKKILGKNLKVIGQFYRAVG